MSENFPTVSARSRFLSHLMSSGVSNLFLGGQYSDHLSGRASVGSCLSFSSLFSQGISKVLKRTASQLLAMYWKVISMPSGFVVPLQRRHQGSIISFYMTGFYCSIIYSLREEDRIKYSS